MTCGIYKLTFGEDYFYIGKSVNVEERYIQHCRKFNNGTAAAVMQRAFDNYGAPGQILLMQCHEDHLDVLEPLFIHINYNSAYCLNSDKPKVYHNSSDIMIGAQERLLFQMSTMEQINEILKLRKSISSTSANHTLEYNKLKLLPTIMDAVDLQKELDLFNEAKRTYNQETSRLYTRVRVLEEQLIKEKSKSWWTKLWE